MLSKTLALISHICYFRKLAFPKTSITKSTCKRVKNGPKFFSCKNPGWTLLLSTSRKRSLFFLVHNVQSCPDGGLFCMFTRSLASYGSTPYSSLPHPIFPFFCLMEWKPKNFGWTFRMRLHFVGTFSLKTHRKTGLKLFPFQLVSPFRYIPQRILKRIYGSINAT